MSEATSHTLNYDLFVRDVTSKASNFQFLHMIRYLNLLLLGYPFLP